MKILINEHNEEQRENDVRQQQEDEIVSGKNIISEGKKRTIKPTLTLYGRRNRINIGRDTIRALNMPQYVCLLQGIACHSIAIVHCEEKNNMSFQVPDSFLIDHRTMFTINSKAYVHQLMDACGLDKTKTYQFSGEADDEGKAVTFDLDASSKF